MKAIARGMTKFVGLTKFVDGVLYSHVPSVVKIKRNKHGWLGVFAEKQFNSGDMMWSDRELRMSDEELPEEIPLITNQGEFFLEKNCHPAWYSEPYDHWQLYGFDSFMNHSCDANSHMIILDGKYDLDDCQYGAFASKRIEIGDEITANYNSWEWDSAGNEFECLCGSNNCCKKVGGFKFLPIDQKLKVLSHNIAVDLKKRWEEEENVIVIDDLMCPETVEINDFGTRFGITSKKVFAKDELIYSVENIKIINSPNQKIAANVNGTYTMLDNTNYLIWGRDHAEFTYFDIFMVHASDPNVYKKYITRNTYNVYASTDINIGDELKM